MAAIDEYDRRLCFLNENPQQHSSFPAADRYQLLEEISRGNYGVVRKACDNDTGEIVAIKEEFDGAMSESTLREIALLKSLPRHPSIVQFIGAIVDEQERAFVVMEYVENDLGRLMAKKPRPFTATGVKSAMRQILEGVAFLHDHGVMHRDIKPSNILTTGSNKLKLCDFGLSRYCQSEWGAYSPGVVTQWYRAPELLLGVEVYSFGIDLWSVGCVMAEMVLGHVLFRGRSEVHQLDCIYQIMGENGGFMLRSMLAAAAAYQAAAFHAPPLLTPLGIDLLERLLACDVWMRITAREALNHAWFREL